MRRVTQYLRVGARLPAQGGGCQIPGAPREGVGIAKGEVLDILHKTMGRCTPAGSRLRMPAYLAKGVWGVWVCKVWGVTRTEDR